MVNREIVLTIKANGQTISTTSDSPLYCVEIEVCTRKGLQDPERILHFALDLRDYVQLPQAVPQSPLVDPPP